MREDLLIFTSLVLRGGSRPPKEQTHLITQMEKAVKTYKARFIINLSELGEDDPLMQNATWNFQSFKVPWYTTKALELQGADYFLKQVKIPYGKTLDVIVMDTSSLQDPSSGSGKDQLNWLMRTLEASTSTWCIVAGFRPMVACNENIEQMERKEVLEPMHRIFLKYGVNAYLSGQACANSSHKGDIADIGSTGPYFTTINQRVAFNKETVDGFLLHRVSSLEIVTYFVTFTWEVVHRVELQQWGKKVMQISDEKDQVLSILEAAAQFCKRFPHSFMYCCLVTCFYLFIIHHDLRQPILYEPLPGGHYL